MSLFNTKLVKGLRVESLGGYSMIHNVSIKHGRIGVLTKVSEFQFTVLFEGDTKGIGFPLCGKSIFKLKD
jgi:hypothetical protein